jgi:hypothetical protein
LLDGPALAAGVQHFDQQRASASGEARQKQLGEAASRGNDGFRALLRMGFTHR